jgi:hypothetical protein
LQQGWARFGWNILRQFYLDLPLIRLGPDIIHFEFGSLAVGRTHLKELLDAKLSVSFRGMISTILAWISPIITARCGRTLMPLISWVKTFGTAPRCVARRLGCPMR